MEGFQVEQLQEHASHAWGVVQKELASIWEMVDKNETISSTLQEWNAYLDEQRPEALQNIPAVHLLFEVLLVGLVLYMVLFARAYDPKKKGAIKLSKQEQAGLIADWKPEPLVAPAADEDAEKRPVPADFPVVERTLPRSRAEVRGCRQPVINAASGDFLALNRDPRILAVAADVMNTHAVGSCGPRGFYGSTRKHLSLEDRIAAWYGVPESITYSDPVSTVASAIPAFAKRGDLLVVDSAVNHSVRTGCNLARSQVVTFRHNDMADLERVLRQVREKDRRGQDLSFKQRRFIVTEGVFADTGRIAPLRRIIELRKKYKFRLILDDFIGIGSLGAHGKGSIEHAGVPLKDVDVLLGSMSTALCSVGGFCVGAAEMVDHQRLSGAGYCFSASLPPYLCAVAERAVDLMHEEPWRLQALRRASRCMHALAAGVRGLTVVSEAPSPVVHLALTPVQDGGEEPTPEEVVEAGATASAARAAEWAATQRTGYIRRPACLSEERALLQDIFDAVLRAGVLPGVAVEISGIPEGFVAQPTLRLHLSTALSDDDLVDMAKAVDGAAAKVLGAKGRRPAFSTAEFEPEVERAAAAAADEAPADVESAGDSPAAADEDEEEEEEEEEAAAPRRRNTRRQRARSPARRGRK